MTNDFMYKEFFLVNFMCLNSIDLLFSSLITLTYSICQICPVLKMKAEKMNTVSMVREI